MTCLQYSPQQIANAFLDRAWNDKMSLDFLPIQRLVYIACGFSLGFERGQMCIELPKAMEYGPMFSSLSKCFRVYGSGPILHYARRFFFVVHIPYSDADTHKLLDSVWVAHRNCNGTQLMAITNMEGTPWFETWDDGKGSGKKISKELMKEFFSKLAPETTIKSSQVLL